METIKDKKVLIVPIGNFPHNMGMQKLKMKTILDIYEKLKNLNRDIVIDYEHESMDPHKRGIAAGWVKSSTLSIGKEGIYALVDWTEDALKMIDEKKYRFLSPVFKMKNGVITALYNLGLTNNPNINVMPALSNSQQKEEQMESSIKLKVREALGIDSKADDQLVIDAFMALFDIDKNDTISKICIENIKKLLKIDDKNFTEDQLIEKITSLVEDNEKQRKLLDQNSVENAINSGKLDPALKGWAMKLLLNDRDAFEEYINNSISKVSIGRLAISEKVTTPIVSLTPNQIRVCKDLGIDQEDFYKYSNLKDN